MRSLSSRAKTWVGVGGVGLESWGSGLTVTPPIITVHLNGDQVRRSTNIAVTTATVTAASIVIVQSTGDQVHRSTDIIVTTTTVSTASIIIIRLKGDQVPTSGRYHFGSFGRAPILSRSGAHPPK